MKTKVIIIAGPTASGKTELAIKVAKEVNGEIINADSRQLYYGLDVGTNKGTLKLSDDSFCVENKLLNAYEMEDSNIKGWLFNFLNPDEVFSVGKFREYCLKIIEKIVNDGKTPIVVGGTGLYIDSLIKKYQLVDVKPDMKLRSELKGFSPSALFERLFVFDRDRAEALNNSDKNNPHRLIRAIEVSMADKINKLDSIKDDNDYLLIYPNYIRENLFKKINKRVPCMFAEGIIEETQKAMQSGYSKTTILNGMGYKQVQDFLKGDISKQEAIDLTAQEHRKYAKRQATWFESENRKYNLKRFDFELELQEVVAEVQEFLKN